MKRAILYTSISVASFLTATVGMSQTLASADQNPNFEVSRQKYMLMADSLTTWHSTTHQETYKAIDYLEDKKAAREDRQAFRRELRRERVRNNASWYQGYYSNPGDFYYRPQFRNRYDNRSYRFRPRGDRFFWNALPTALTFGLLCR